MKKEIAALLVTLLFMALLAPAALAQDTDNQTGERQLTLQEAYDLAAKNSRALKKAELAVDRAEEVKKFRLDQVTYTPSGPTPTEAATTFTVAAMADTAYQMAVKSKKVAEETLYLSVVQHYNDLIAAQEKLKLSQKSLANAQLQNRINNLSLALGMTSQIEYKVGHSGYEIAQVEVENAQTALEKAYTAFNNLLGINVAERPVLLECPSFEPMDIDNIETHISRVLSQDPNIWMTEQSVNLAALELDLYNWMNPSRDPYAAEKIDVKTAELSAADTRSKMEQVLRTLYNSIKQMEEGYRIQEQLLNIAEQNLAIKKLKYEVGMVSDMEMSTAQLEADKARLDLEQTSYLHMYYKMALEKPWAYLGGLSDLTGGTGGNAGGSGTGMSGQ